MRWWICAMLACSGSPAKPVQAPAPAPTATVADELGPPSDLPSEVVASPPAAPPPPTPKASIYDRLAEVDGPVAGMPGWSIRLKANPAYCGGVEIVTTRGKRAPAGDEVLAEVYALEFPSGLRFDGNTEAKRKAQQKFQAFITSFGAVRQKVDKTYGTASFSKDASMEQRVVAAARAIQAYRRMASVFAHAPVPQDILVGDESAEGIRVYCETIIDQSEMFLDVLETTRIACARTAADASLIGWWNDVCSAP